MWRHPASRSQACRPPHPSPRPSRPAVRTEPCGNIRRINVEIPSLSLSDMRRLKATDKVRRTRSMPWARMPAWVPDLLMAAQRLDPAVADTLEQLRPPPPPPPRAFHIAAPMCADWHLHSVPGDLPPPHFQAHAHRGAQVGWVGRPCTTAGCPAAGASRDTRLQPWQPASSLAAVDGLDACPPPAASSHLACSNPAPPPWPSPPPAADYDNRVMTHDRAMRAGLDDVGLGTLFGLYDYKYEVRVGMGRGTRAGQAAGAGSLPGWLRLPWCLGTWGAGFLCLAYMILLWEHRRRSEGRSSGSVQRCWRGRCPERCTVHHHHTPGAGPGHADACQPPGARVRGGAAHHLGAAHAPGRRLRRERHPCMQPMPAKDVGLLDAWLQRT